MGTNRAAYGRKKIVATNLGFVRKHDNIEVVFKSRRNPE